MDQNVRGGYYQPNLNYGYTQQSQQGNESNSQLPFRSSGIAYSPYSSMEYPAHQERLSHIDTSFVTPNQTTRINGSWPCEQTAATVDNKNRVAVIIGKYDEISYRYLQSRDNSKFFKKLYSTEAAFTLLHVALGGVNLYNGNNFGAAINIGSAISGAGFIAPHTCVSAQYGRIQNTNESILRERFGDQFLSELNSCSRDKDGLNKAIQLLHSYSYGNTSFLDDKLHTIAQRAQYPMGLDSICSLIDRYLLPD